MKSVEEKKIIGSSGAMSEGGGFLLGIIENEQYDLELKRSVIHPSLPTDL